MIRTNWLRQLGRRFSQPTRRRRYRPSIAACESLEQRTLLTAPVVAEIALANDTGDPTDNVTSDATITGTVTDDVTAANLIVEIDVDNDGTADTTTLTDANGVFQYNLAINIGYGSHTIQARAMEWDGTQYVYGGWTSLSFTYQNDPPQVTSVGLANDTGDPNDNITQDPTISGSIANDGDPGNLIVEFDLDGDGVADASTMTDLDGNFSYDLGPHISYGTVTVKVRVMEWDSELGQYIAGDWVEFTFEFEAPETTEEPI